MIAALLGGLGRGPLSEAHLRTGDGSLELRYHRIARYSTPSILLAQFGNAAVHDGVAQLWIADNIMTGLGNRTVVPQPTKSGLVNQGTLYTFDANANPGRVEFMLEPASPGIQDIRLQVPGFQELQTKIVVMP